MPCRRRVTGGPPLGHGARRRGRRARARPARGAERARAGGVRGRGRHRRPRARRPGARPRGGGETEVVLALPHTTPGCGGRVRADGPRAHPDEPRRRRRRPRRRIRASRGRSAPTSPSRARSPAGADEADRRPPGCRRCTRTRVDRGPGASRSRRAELPGPPRASHGGGVEGDPAIMRERVGRRRRRARAHAGGAGHRARGCGIRRHLRAGTRTCSRCSSAASRSSTRPCSRPARAPSSPEAPRVPQRRDTDPTVPADRAWAVAVWAAVSDSTAGDATAAAGASTTRRDSTVIDRVRTAAEPWGCARRRGTAPPSCSRPRAARAAPREVIEVLASEEGRCSPKPTPK